MKYGVESNDAKMFDWKSIASENAIFQSVDFCPAAADWGATAGPARAHSGERGSEDELPARVLVPPLVASAIRRRFEHTVQCRVKGRVFPFAKTGIPGTRQSLEVVDGAVGLAKAPDARLHPGLHRNTPSVRDPVGLRGRNAPRG